MRKRFNQYYLTKQIANKSSGSVYLAHHVSNESQKVILEILDGICFTFNQQGENVFQKIQMIKQLRHSSIVPILDLGIEQGQPYVVRQHHTCESLRHRLEHLSPQRLNLQEALTIIQQVGQTLSYAHQHHIFHGNIRPETILLKSNGKILLSDFGLADFINVTKPSQKSDPRTISYMAPEQFVGSLTEKSDQYALACLAYELITGCVPFSAQSSFSAIAPISVEHVSAKAIKRGESGDRDQVILGQAGNFCENSQCPDYGKVGKNNVCKYGKTRKGAQRWRCKTCQATWSSSSMWAKDHPEFLIPLSDLVPDLPRPIQEAVLKAMAKDPSDRYSTISLFLKALERASSSTLSVISRRPLMGPSFSTFIPTVAEPLENLESDIALPMRLNEAPPATRFSERSEHVDNGYESGKALVTAAGDTSVEASLGNRLSHVGKLSTPTLWLAFALSGIILLLGTMLLYILVPLRSPGSISPAKGSPTVSIAATPAHMVNHVTPTIQTTPTTVQIVQPTITGSSVVQTITFDDLAQTDHSLEGQYPKGVIDWGQNTWEIMPPSAYDYPSNVIQFANKGMQQASFTFLQPHKLLQFDAFNGGGATTASVTLSCAGLPSVSASIAPGKVVTVKTGWNTACSTPTLHSSNGWNMLFDNLLIASL